MAVLPITLTNPDAESGTGTTDSSPIAVPGWTIVNDATVVQYQSVAGGFPTTSEPGPPSRGTNFFCGAYGQDNCSLTQSLSFAGHESTVDVGGVDFALSAYIGGWQYQEDNAVISLVWKNGGGGTISTSTIGPVTMADRGSNTGLLLRSTSGTVPATTRTVDVVMTFTRTAGFTNDGYVDSISLVFSDDSIESPTADNVVSDLPLEPFYWLKISGLPYYFGSTIDPTNTIYGSSAWSTPSGYSSGFWKRGMMLPDDTVEQKVPDLIGGICSPERIRLKLLDFPDPVNQGYNYFARLFAPGRALTSGTVGQLAQGVTASTSSLSVRTPVAFIASTPVHVGPEYIEIGAVGALGANGLQALTITNRNRFPAHIGFPLTPYHRVTQFDSNSEAVGGVPVTTDIITIYGRTAALYMGHMKPDGTPEAEASAVCLMIGKIQAIDVDDDGTNYQLTLESLTADLDKGQVAPDLAADTIKPGFYLGTGVNADWLQFEIVMGSGAAYQIVIPSATYSQQELVAAVNASIFTAGVGGLGAGNFGVSLITDAANHFAFQAYGYSSSYKVRVTQKAQFFAPDPGSASLLYALGFDPEGTTFESNRDTSTSLASRYFHIVATRPAASVFIPTERSTTTGVAITLNHEQSASFFNAAQSSVTSDAFVRFGNGMVVRLVSASTVNNTLSLGPAVQVAGLSNGGDGKTFYYATDDATAEQVVYLNGSRIIALAQLLCSTSAVASDTEFNVFNEGVGLGWNSIVTKADWRAGHLDSNGIAATIVVDRKTTFGELFKPIARERGLFIVWDPITGTYRLRKIQVPSQQAAGFSPTSASTFVFSESNRVAPTHRSRMQQDRSSMRSSWTIKRGYDWSTKEFVEGSVTFNNEYARSFFPNGVRAEEIEDKTLSVVGGPSRTLSSALGGLRSAASNPLSEFIADMAARTWLYVFPWQKILRSVNKTGLMLSPGTYHQVIDNTLVNPSTGAAGITASDGVYAFLAGVTKNYSTGECSVELMVFATTGAGLISSWSPCGLVQYEAANNGYDAPTKTLTMMAYYTAQVGMYDGIDFAVGDKVRVCARDWSTASPSSENDTIASIGASGSTITLTTGLSFFSSAVESIVQLRPYGDATASRQSGATRVTWQGDATTLLIDSSTGTRIMRWQ